MRGRSNPEIALLLLLGVSLIYIALSRGFFLYGDDILMYQVTEAIVDHGTIAVTSPVDDANVATAVPGEDGRGYAKYGIGQSLVAIPFYVAANQFVAPALDIPTIEDVAGNERGSPEIYVTSMMNGVIGGTVVALTFLLVNQLGYERRTALITALLLAFGTLMAHYSATFLSEPLSALCLTATVFGIVHAAYRPLGKPHVVSRQVSVAWLVFSGFFAGLAIAVKLVNVTALVAPGLWVCWIAIRMMRDSMSPWRRPIMILAAWGAPLVAWLAVAAWYNWARFGSVTTTGYGREATAAAFPTPLLEGIYGLLASPGRGVIWYSPPLLLSIVGIWWFAKRHGAIALVIGGMLLGTLLLYGRYYTWYGGGVWGTRFLVPLLPLLILPAAEVVARAVVRRWAVGAVAVAMIAGLFVTAVGFLVPFDRYVAEYSQSREARRDSFFQPSASPLVVHVRELPDASRMPDLAHNRYGDPTPRRIATVAGILGSGLIAASVVLSFRGSRRDAMVT